MVPFPVGATFCCASKGFSKRFFHTGVAGATIFVTNHGHEISKTILWVEGVKQVFLSGL